MLPALQYDTTDWLALCALAFVIDLILGSPRLLGRLPGPDQLFIALNRFLAAKLDRPQRSARARRLRGGLLLVLFLPALFFLGALLDRHIFASPIAGATALALGVLLIGQRAMWQAAIAAGAMIGGSPDLADRHIKARQVVQALLLKFSDGFVSNILVLCVGGFALLLPVRFLAAMVTSGNAQSLVSKPESPFFRPACMAYDIAGLAGAFLAALILAAAQILVPGTSLTAIKGMRPKHLQGLVARSLPLSVAADGLGIVFEGSGKDKDGKKRWLGPPDGKARLSSIDIRKSLMLVFVGTAIAILAGSMIAAYILTKALPHG